MDMSAAQPRSASPQSNGQPLSHPNADSAQMNGASDHNNTSNSSYWGPIDDQPDTSNPNQEAIREGKQKAKETIAAAFNPQGSPAGQGQQAKMSVGSVQPNGGPQLSRKRSRDGTRLPISAGATGGSKAEEGVPPRDEILLDRYIQRDILYGGALNDQAERLRSLVKAKESERDYYMHEIRQRRMTNPGSIFGYGYLGYGNRLTDGKNQIVYSESRGAPKGRKSKQLYIPRKNTAQLAEQHEELVPVRLDIEFERLRLRDTFTWNLHEKFISQDMFLACLMEDLKVPPEAVPDTLKQIRLEMREQIDNYYPHISVEDGPLEAGRPYSEHKDDELRIMIKLNITIGRITLIDQFEWDINNTENSPEEFARQMACENALSGEFTTAIAHSIREQSQLYTKSLFLTNHTFDGKPVEDPELRESFLPTPLSSSFRPVQTQKDWTPYMYEMSEAELERTETSMMREHRAQKRQLNRRGGPALPDLKDRQRTVRSLIMHAVIPGAVETFETTGIPKLRRGGRGTRRAGARVEGEVDSDDLESDDSDPESPAPSVLNANAGTARTRGLRGAASAAQAAMRANFARSQTPDSQAAATPHEPRSSARRSVLRDESVADDESLIVKLKINKAKLKAFVENVEKKKRAAAFPLSGYASQPAVSTAATPSKPAPAAGQGTRSMTPKALPHNRSTPQPNGGSKSTTAQQKQRQYDNLGRIEIDHWPSPDDEPPPPPTWLEEKIQTLRDQYPESSFEPIMRAICVNSSGETVRIGSPEPGAPPPRGTKLHFAPRIRCNDCPAKLYNANPDSVAEDFAVHLRNRQHRERVQNRRDGEAR